MLHLFDGAAWVDIGPGAEGGGGVALGPVPPVTPAVGQFWFDGFDLWIWNGTAWVPTTSTQSFVQATAPLSPTVGDTWWDGSHQWIWDGTAWQLIGPSGGTVTPPPALPSITPVQIVWAANIVPDFSRFINAYINVTGNFVLGTPINVTPGQRGIIKLNQDAVGGHTWMVSSGWYFLGGAGAPPLSTPANARDILHYYVGEQSIVYGELHEDFAPNSGSTAPPVVSSTPIGSMSLNGGLAAAFDGVNQKHYPASARATFTSTGGTVSGFVGKSYSTPQRVLSATFWPPNDPIGQGCWFDPGSGVPNHYYSAVVNLRGLTGSTPPSSASGGTLLASFSYGPGIDGQYAPPAFLAPAALVPNDMTTAFSYVWVEVAVTYNGSSTLLPQTIDTYCSQLILDVHT